MSSDRISVRSVARAAGVSPMSASLALSGNKGVGKGRSGMLKQEMVDRILKVAETLGYEVDRSRGRNPQVEGDVKYILTDREVAFAEKLGRQWSLSGGYDLSECQSEARYAAVRASYTWDPQKGAFPTHLHWTVRSRLRVRFSHFYSKFHLMGVSFFSGDQPLGDDSDDCSGWDVLDSEIHPLFDRSSISFDHFEIGDFLNILSNSEARLIDFVFFKGNEVPQSECDLLESAVCKLRSFLVVDRLIVKGDL